MSPSSCQRADEAIAMIEGDQSKVLQMSIGSIDKVQPGQFVSKADAEGGPKFSVSSVYSGNTYLIVGLDLDAPYVSWPFLSPLVHEIQSDLQLGPVSEDTALLEAGNTAPTCEWLAALPPPGAAPHRYVFLLYKQPAKYDLNDFKISRSSKTGIRQRIRFNLEAFEKKAGLGSVVAANYFMSN